MPQDSGRMYGISVTSSALTLLDLCTQYDKPEMEVALDDALRRGIVTMPRLRWTAKTMGGRGKKGTSLFNELLQERPRAADLTDSGLEVRFLRIIRSAQLPEPVPQYRVFEGKQFIGRADFAFPDNRVAIELESYQYHQGRPRWKKDLKRQDAFSEAGWIVRHFTYDELVGDPEGVCNRVRRALGL